MDDIRQMSSDLLHAYRLQQASSIKLPYLALGLIAIALGIAIVGGAIVPVLVGVLADRIGIHHPFALSLICYL
jgi:fucose permease